MYYGAKLPPALPPPPAVGQPQRAPPARDQRHSKAPSVPRDGSKLGTSYMAANSKALLHLQLANRSQPPCLQCLSLMNFICAPSSTCSWLPLPETGASLRPPVYQGVVTNRAPATRLPTQRPSSTCSRPMLDSSSYLQPWTLKLPRAVSTRAPSHPPAPPSKDRRQSKAPVSGGRSQAGHQPPGCHSKT